MPFAFRRAQELPDVVVVEPPVFTDERGFFMESFKQTEFEAAGLPTRFVQDGHARNVGRGTLRGLHYQAPPAAQGKLVRCIVGRCLDVAVDVRRGSPTYARHVAVELSAQSHRMLWIPEGFAHGYLTLTDECELLYKFSGSEYSRDHARSVLWNDPALGIQWPVERPLLAAKDATAPPLRDVRDF